MTQHRGGGGSRPGGRSAAVRVRSARGRTTSSTRWLQRQLNDPYVAEARRRGYRSRAAFKLLQLDEKFGLIRPGMRVVDLGAAPGGWAQVLSRKVGGRGRIVALDILPMEPLEGVEVLELDFLDERVPALLRQALGGPVDLVLSDMAQPAVGHRQTDHLRIMALAEAAYTFATEVLAPGGAFVTKLFQGGEAESLFRLLRRDFARVRNAKPEASRAESSETYVVATGFRGGGAQA